MRRLICLLTAFAVAVQATGIAFASVVDERGKSVSFTYDAAGQLTDAYSQKNEHEEIGVVAETHTYFVQAGDASVWVHNKWHANFDFSQPVPGIYLGTDKKTGLPYVGGSRDLFN